MRAAVIIATLTTIGVVGAVPIPAGAIPGGIFIASPDGSGTDCSPASPCSLQQAVTEAGNYTMSTPTVDLDTGTYQDVHLDLTEPIAIAASTPSAPAPVLQGNGSDPVITVETALNGITGITVTGGTDGLYIPFNGTAGSVTNSSFNDNANHGIDDISSGFDTYTGVTADGNSGSGIAISGSGEFEIFDSTFSNNGLDGITVAALNNGNDPIVPVNNSTLYGNDASGATAVNEGTLELSYSTIVNNGQHGLYTDNDGSIRAGADLLSGNGGGSPAADCANGGSQPSPIVTDAGYNIADDNTCPFGGNSKLNTGSDVGAFGLYGGPTETVPIPTTSAAAGLVTAGPDSMSNLCGGGQKDQRGLVRPSVPCAAGSFDPGATTLDSTIDLTADPDGGAVHGDTITLTATVSGGVGPSSGGTVEFDAGPAGGVLTQITDCNQDVIAAIPVVDGSATCQIPADPGTYDLSATFSGSQTYNASGPATISSYLVKYFSTTTVVVDSASHLSATVEADPDAGGIALPTGHVTFKVDGTAVGTPQPLDGTETAGLTLDPPLSGAHAISAVYAGDSHYGGSTDSTETTNPTITASISSKGTKSKAGWWKSAVIISFNCTKGSSDIDGSCPAPVTLTASKAKQTVHRTITDLDGGTASVTSKPVNIDRVKPVVKITGVKPGHTYPKGTKLHPKCVAKDALSGLAGPCKLTVTHHKKRTKVVYTATATATDKARNVDPTKIHWDIKSQK